jgi:2',3'-cyclic-nucleotide 2'-phosphodiesterase (5'-nucleotidase family)
MKIRSLLLWLALWLVCVHLYAGRREVHILSANDMHATVWNFPQLAAIADSLRALYPDLLVLSGGDNRTGDPVSDRYEIPAYPMVALMNQVGFSASALGNHDFDVHSLAPLTLLSNFRYLCANMTADDSTNVRVVPSQVFDVNGLRVGIVGVIQLSPNGIPSTHPDNLKGLHFQPAKDVIGQYEWMSKTCDVTLLLSHLGYEEDRQMARLFPWIDVIVGGHTHTQLKGDEMENGVLITQNRNKLRFVTHTTLTLDSTGCSDDGVAKWHVADKHSEYINVPAFSQRNKTVEQMVAFFSNSPELRRVLAHAETPFEVPEELGCMICDAFKEECQADIAVVNPGGIRIDSLSQGDITVRDVFEIDPFDNHAVVLTLTGHELLHMMLSYCHNRKFSFPFVAGMQCVLTTKKDNPRIIESVKLLKPDGRPLDMKKRYRVATNSYIVATSQIPEGSDEHLNLLTTDLMMQFLQRRANVSYQGERRVHVAP